MLIVVSAAACGRRAAYDIARYDGYWFGGERQGECTEVGIERNQDGQFPPLLVTTSRGTKLVMNSLDRSIIEAKFEKKAVYTTVENGEDVEEVKYEDGQTVLRWSRGNFCSLSSRDAAVGYSDKQLLKLPASFQDIQDRFGRPRRWTTAEGGNP